MLQTDTNMAYDLDGGQLLFETAFAPPPHLKVSLMVVVHLVAWVLLFYPVPEVAHACCIYIISRFLP